MNLAELTIEPWPIEKLVPYARNARKIPAAAVEKVALSIEQFGFRQPIVVDKEGVVVIGHVRRLAALHLKLATVPVHVADNLDAKQIRALRIMDNRSHDETSWDLDLLGPEISDLLGEDVSLGLTGFDDAEWAKLFDGAGQEHHASLDERFGVPPFSVLDARQGYWQDRKRAWLALGIQSELGRGEQLIPNGGGMESKERYDGACPGGSPRPACDYSNRQRGDGKGRAV